MCIDLHHLNVVILGTLSYSQNIGSAMPPDIARKVAAFFANYPERQFVKKHVLIQAGEDPRGRFSLLRARCGSTI